MRIYLAGKVSQNDWRGAVLRVPPWDAYVEPGEPLEWPVAPRAIFETHDYTGPYFVDSGAHYFDAPHSSHGVGADGSLHAAGLGYLAVGQADVVALCLRAVARSDLVFAWLDDPTAHGTLVEIGYALGLGVPVVVATPEARAAAVADLWFARWAATAVAVGGDSPATALREALRDEVVRAAARARCAPAPPGHVYFVQRGAAGEVKIGYSENVTRRLAALQTATPDRLRLLATLPGSPVLERSLHARFARHHVGGEWFRPAAELLAYVAGLAAGSAP